MEKNIKQVIVWRNDLKVRKGKIAAQAAHASISFLTRGASFPYDRDIFKRCFQNQVFPEKKLEHIREWVENGMTKICVYVNSKEELEEIYSKAISAGIIANFVIDSGKTEFNGVPTMTCLALGPDEGKAIDAITGRLKLL